MLDIEDLCLAYRETIIINHFNLHLERGEIVCVYGKSGGGKTSLLNAILGFVPLRSGKISIDGLVLSPTTIDFIRQKVAWLPQELALPSEKVSEMVRLPFLLKGNKNISFNKAKLLNTFKQLGLDEKLYDKRVSEVSGGQRQRIMIAAVAMLQKPLFVVDEPTSALDEVSTEKVITFFHYLASTGTAILLVSHNEQLCNAADKRICI